VACLAQDPTVETMEWGDVEEPRQLKDIIAGLLLTPRTRTPRFPHLFRPPCAIGDEVLCCCVVPLDVAHVY